MMFKHSKLALLLTLLTLVFGLSSHARATSDAEKQTAEITAEFDRRIEPLIEKWKIPGISVAVAKEGKLILAKGYGFADLDKHLPVTNSTLFRMGSINKTLTAAAIMKLAEQGKLDLDDFALPYLRQANATPETPADSRAISITIRHLLQHTGGFDRKISGDPFFGQRLFDVAIRQKIAPVTCEAIVRDSLSLPLDFEPGSRQAYSNLGYCMLGLVVRVASGESYQTYVNRELLLPSIGKQYVAGESLASMPNESSYYMPAGSARTRAAPGLNGVWGVQAPYGSYSIENMEALGAWVATPLEVLKFFLAIDGTRGTALLRTDSIKRMQSAPVFNANNNLSITRSYYGIGLNVRPTPFGPNWWHDGSQPGLTTLALRTAEGYAWVFAINTRPAESNQREFFSDFDQAMWNAARSVRNWPSRDLIE
jgi:N-acyl-D-amino-acid deacylase